MGGPFRGGQKIVPGAVAFRLAGVLDSGICSRISRPAIQVLLNERALTLVLPVTGP